MWQTAVAINVFETFQLLHILFVNQMAEKKVSGSKAIHLGYMWYNRGSLECLYITFITSRCMLWHKSVVQTNVTEVIRITTVYATKRWAWNLAKSRLEINSFFHMYLMWYPYKRQNFLRLTQANIEIYRKDYDIYIYIYVCEVCREFNQVSQYALQICPSQSNKLWCCGFRNTLKPTNRL